MKSTSQKLIWNNLNHITDLSDLEYVADVTCFCFSPGGMTDVPSIGPVCHQMGLIWDIWCKSDEIEGQI